MSTSGNVKEIFSQQFSHHYDMLITHMYYQNNIPAIKTMLEKYMINIIRLFNVIV